MGKENGSLALKELSFFLLVSAMLLLVPGCGDPLQSESAGIGVTGGSANLAWAGPATNSDGSPIADLGGYVVFYGTNSDQYSFSLDVGNINAFSISFLPPGRWYFGVQAYDTSGNRSILSNEMFVEIL